MRHALGLLVSLTGCPSPAPPDPPADDAAPSSDDGATGEDGEPSRPSACDPTATTFDDVSWLPKSTRAAFVIDLGDATIGDALGRLAAFARGEGHPLPIDVAFSLGEWSWQVPSLRATLANAGLSPQQLVYVRTEEASGAWLVHQRCDLPALKTATTAAWGVKWRDTVQAAVATPTDEFAFDVLALPGDRLALVAAGRADAWLAIFRGATLSPGPAGAPSPTAKLLEPPTPVFGVLRGDSLLDPTAPPGTVDMSHFTVEATATDVHTTATLAH